MVCWVIGSTAVLWTDPDCESSCPTFRKKRVESKINFSNGYAADMKS